MLYVSVPNKLWLNSFGCDMMMIIIGCVPELWHKADTTDALPPPEPSEKLGNGKSGTSKGSASNRLSVGSVKLRVKRPLTASCTKLERFTTSVEEHTALLDAEKITLPPLDVSQHSSSVSNATSSRPASQVSGSSSSAPLALLQPIVALTPLSSPTHMPSVSPSTTKSNTLPITPTSASSTPAHPLLMDMSSSSLSTPSPKKRPKLERKCLPIKEREYDPDKHCGVWNGENSKPCTRSLTCKSHPLSMRRAVSGRSKHFDKLLADHRASKDAAVKLVKTVSAVPGMLSQVKIYREHQILLSALKTKLILQNQDFDGVIIFHVFLIYRGVQVSFSLSVSFSCTHTCIPVLNMWSVSVLHFDIKLLDIFQYHNICNFFRYFYMKFVRFWYNILHLV
jgi:hypothetical protein